MAYKTILIYLDASPALEKRIRLAAQLAKQQQAHLIGLAPAGIASIPGADYLSVTTGLVQDLQAQLDERANSAIKTFEDICEQLGVDSVESRHVGNTAIDTLLLHARYADIVVIGQADQIQEPGATTAGFVEQTLLGVGRPVIVVPYAGPHKPVGKRVLFAWDASREATRAVSDALPMLQTADTVEVVVVNADKASHGPNPGADIALYLSRHGVNVEVRDLPSSIDTGNTLLSHAADFSADLMVMGGYGHSRVREWVMGGTTRTILNSMTVPVLMAH